MTEPLHRESTTGSATISQVLVKILRPLVRFLLHHQFTYPQLTALLKSIYVDVADEEMAVDEKRQSDSRINLLTGVHRKDVKRLRAETSADSLTSSSASIGAQLIAQWQGNPEYVDDNGEPLPLPLRSQDASTSSFENLVSQIVKQDIRPRVILDEWLRLGIAHLEDEQLVLNTGAFTPDKGFDEKSFFFAKNIQDHLKASTSNLMGLKPSHFDRSVYYDKLSATSVQELNALADRLGMVALTSMNKAALDKQQADNGNANAKYRINFGVFNYDNLVRTPEGSSDDE